MTARSCAPPSCFSQPARHRQRRQTLSHASTLPPPRTELTTIAPTPPCVAPGDPAIAQVDARAAAAQPQVLGLDADDEEADDLAVGGLAEHDELVGALVDGDPAVAIRGSDARVDETGE